MTWSTTITIESPQYNVIARIGRLLPVFSRQGIARATGQLVGGTIGANLITALALPFVTRLYSPADMNTLAVFASLVIILVVAICARFDVALPIVDNDQDAIDLLAVGVVCALLLSLACAAALFCVPVGIYMISGHPELARLIWLLPPTLFLGGCYSLFQFWFVRRKAFGGIARSRLVQSAAASATQLGFGLLGVIPLGLLLGQALNTGAGAMLLGRRILSEEKALLSNIRWTRMRMLSARYRRFPLYSAPEALANAAGIQLPVILIAAWAVGPEAGFIMLALFVVQAPMSLLGGALGQVYLSEAPARHRAGQLAEFTVDLVANLLKIGVGPILFLGIISPFAFGPVFGSSWTRAGELVAWMTPWFVVQILVAPISLALQVTGQQSIALVLQVGGLLLRVGSVWVAAAVARGQIAEAYALSGFAFYLVYLAVVLRAVGAGPADVFARLIGALPIIAAWSGLGLLAVMLIRYAINALPWLAG